MSRDAGVAPEFLKVMVTLGAAYGVKISAERMGIYAEALGDFDIGVVSLAATRAVRECQFFPTVAELRRLAEGAPDERALAAWAALGSAAEAVGAYRPVEIVDVAAAQALVQVFGSWPAFCAMEDGPAMAMKRQEFLACYRQARRQQPTGSVMLPGLAEGAPMRLLGDVRTTSPLRRLHEGL